MSVSFVKDLLKNKYLKTHCHKCALEVFSCGLKQSPHCPFS